MQTPHPPILVGGNGPKVLERVVAFGDEWLPNRVADVEAFLARVAELQDRGRQAGRDSIPVTLLGTPGSRETLGRLAGAGIHRFVWWLPARPREEVEAKLDEYAELVEQATDVTP